MWAVSLLLRGVGSERRGPRGRGWGRGAGEVPCTVSWIKPRSSPYELMAWQLKNTESPRSAGLSWEAASRGRGQRQGEREEWGESFRAGLLKGAHLARDQQGHLLLGEDPPGVCQGLLFPESSKDGSVEESLQGGQLRSSKRGRG